ncbi:type 1 glutamine amidotransferase domain-containing protein [Hellea balneolensis]|uniref:type 1 glutamine amidotransferase domain-containing protein n=1 Tax=Hellea balneolensis TaxID=287478 RepID=UPI0003FCBF2C|nr:type 1 glutamine amidotransferase domain-containing protein [Hellea balneolensis]
MKKKLFILLGVLVLGAIIFAAALPSILKDQGLHPDYDGPKYDLSGQRALIISTSHAVLNKPGETKGKKTGVFGSELSVPYYDFQDAGMSVDIASIKGGAIPIDPMSYRFMIITDADKRSRKDNVFQSKVTKSLKIDNIDFTQYDVIFLAGGWGAAYDLGQSDVLAEKISTAYYESDAVMGGVCHGPLGLINAKDKDGGLLIAGRKMSGVTDKQIKELKIDFTPLHPEESLRAAGAKFEASTASKDLFATHTVVDDEGRFVTGQNQNSGHVTAHEMMRLAKDQ